MKRFKNALHLALHRVEDVGIPEVHFGPSTTGVATRDDSVNRPLASTSPLSRMKLTPRKQESMRPLNGKKPPRACLSLRICHQSYKGNRIDQYNS
jgi:hypothetical protein